MGDSSGNADTGDEPRSSLNPAPVDFEAAYKESREKLTRVAAGILRAGGLESQADDVVSEAILELVPRRKETPASWEAVMVGRVKWRAMDRFRAAKKVADPLPARNRENEDDETEDEWLSGADLYDPTDDIMVGIDLRAAMKRLPSQEREVLFRVHTLRDTQTEVARDLGLSAGRISQIHTAGMSRLTEILDLTLEEVD